MPIATFNAAGRALIGDADRVRVRRKGRAVEILPTRRITSTGLAEGEILAEVIRTQAGARFELPALPPHPESPQRLIGRPYNWFALVATDEVPPGTPAVTVRA